MNDRVSPVGAANERVSLGAQTSMGCPDVSYKETGACLAPQRVLICTWDGWIGVSPSVLASIAQLNKHQILVDVLARQADLSFPAPPVQGPTSTIEVISSWRASPRLLRLPSPLRQLAGWIAETLDLLRMATVARKLSHRNAFDVVIGIDTYGIAIASAVSKERRCALVYWSLELRFGSSIRNPVAKLLMIFERFLLGRVNCIVVQDSERGNLLAQEYSITTDRMVFIPNSMPGLSNIVSSQYLHERLGLEPTQKIVLHAGMICDEVMSVEIAKSASTLSEEYTFVFHERRQRSSTEPYLAAVQQAGGPRLKLSLTPVPIDDVDRIFASAYVGVVAYSDKYGANFSEIASASGKLSYFLRNRIPVIVNDIPSLKRFVQETGCGVVVTDLAAIPSALAKISSNYPAFRVAAERAFLHRLDFAGPFERAFSPFLRLQPTAMARSAPNKSDGTVI